MLKRACITGVIALGFLSISAQINIGGFIKDRANEAKDKAKTKVREKTTESWEKKRQEYDESNFNYAISFLDNSGLFEADEKGNSFTSTALNSLKYVNNEEKSPEDRAYTNLKNGEILMAGNKYYLAEQSFKLAKLLYEQQGLTENVNYAQTISDLGLLYQSRGRYSKAKVFDEQAVQLRQNGTNKGMLVVSLNNDAVLKKETGFYAEAEKELQRAQELALELKDTLAVALINNNRAMICLDMNRLKDAEKYMLLAVDNASQVLKENSGNFIKIRVNLANVYRFAKKYKEAESIYLQAIDAKEKKLGAHPDLAHLKKGLAQLYMEMGRYEDVEKLLLSALEINKRKLGDNNPATVSTQQELANFYRYMNKPLQALPLITKVVEKKKIIYGESHPGYIQSLEDQSLAQWQNNKIVEAKDGYKTVIENTLQYINTFFSSLSENEKTLYWDKTSTRLQRFYNFAWENIKSDPSLIKDLYSTCINTKGFLLNNSSKIRNIIAASNDADLQETYRLWLDAKENLNLAYQLSKEEIVQEKINVDSLTSAASELEKKLSQKSAAFRAGSGNQNVTIEEIQQSLTAGEAAVEIIEINDYKNGFTGKANYVAIVVKQDDIKSALLGSEETIDRAVSEFRKKTIDQLPENAAYSVAWKPADDLLAGVSRLYLSLDGTYHQLSINALKDTEGKYLADRYAIQFVGNTRDLISVKHNEQDASRPATAFLIGNPLYGNSGTIAQLPGTEAEVKNINRLLNGFKVQTTVLYGKDATEEKVKKINSPGIFHIATHGYFLPDVSEVESNKVLGVDINAARENPLLRSGVLLAGCENVFDPDYHPSPNSENGVLTAYEAMSLNLDKTDLVVLSACETGLGNVKQGEGVYGLQRAFMIAGTKSIIMSLWSVSDEGTMELMTLFYTNYAKSGNKYKAFNDAIKQLKVKYKEPFFWGAFIMLSR